MWILSQKDIETNLIYLFILAAFHFIELFYSNYSLRFDCLPAYAFTKKARLTCQCFFEIVKTKKNCYTIHKHNGLPTNSYIFLSDIIPLDSLLFVIYLFEKTFLHLWEHHISTHNIVYRTKEKRKNTLVMVRADFFLLYEKEIRKERCFYPRSSFFILETVKRDFSWLYLSLKYFLFLLSMTLQYNTLLHASTLASCQLFVLHIVYISDIYWITDIFHVLWLLHTNTFFMVRWMDAPNNSRVLLWSFLLSSVQRLQKFDFCV